MLFILVGAWKTTRSVCPMAKSSQVITLWHYCAVTDIGNSVVHEVSRCNGYSEHDINT